MKIRWTRGSVRLRISPAELERLEFGQPIGEALELPGGRWSVRLEPSGETAFTLEGGVMRLGLSGADLARLSAPGAEGIYFETPGEPRVAYYVEKDFPCEHPRAAGALEPAAGTFARPEESRAGPD